VGRDVSEEENVMQESSDLIESVEVVVHEGDEKCPYVAFREAFDAYDRRESALTGHVENQPLRVPT